MVVENAKIHSTFLGYEDHGILTASIELRFEGGGQSFGGWSFDEPIEHGTSRPRKATPVCGEFIRSITSLFGKWESLPGQYVRMYKHEGHPGPIIAIGHIVEDRWVALIGQVGLLEGTVKEIQQQC